MNDLLKIVSLGGFGEVTQNMFVYHYLPGGREENDQILIVDVGVGFPGGDALGVDMVIPDFTYVLRRQEKVVGILLTHGHEDHIGALPFFLTKFKRRVPIFTGRLTKGLVETKMADFGVKGVRVQEIKPGDQVRLGVFTAEPVRVTHSIPDTYHYFLRTPVGNFYHGSDFKFDPHPPDNKPSQLARIARFGDEGILGLLSDSLGSEREGVSPSERELASMFATQIKTARGRVFVTAISSNIYRWQQAIAVSREVGRKVCLVGMSVEKNVKLAQKLGYLQVRDQDFVDLRRAKKLADRQVTFLIGGSLGQVGSSLYKVISGQHRLHIKPHDRIIFSSPDYIPGTSQGLYTMIDNLIKAGAEVIYHEVENERLHVSGHGARRELALLLELARPKYAVPIGGSFRQARQYLQLAREMGYRENQLVLPQENTVLVYNRTGLTTEELKPPLRQVFVDGLGVGDVGKVVLRDRRVLAKEGVLVLVMIYDGRQKRLVEPVTVMSRGFVYEKENKDFLRTIANLASQIFHQVYHAEAMEDFALVRQRVQGAVEEYIYQETGRQPMVLPLLMKV